MGFSRVQIFAKSYNICFACIIIGLILGTTIRFSQKNIPQPERQLEASFKEKKAEMYSKIRLACFPESRFDCANNSCKPIAPASYYLVDYKGETGTYFRCTKEGCDPLPVNVVPSGQFTQFIPKDGRAMLFKVSTGEIVGKGHFIDLATIATTTVVSSGSCEFLR